MQAGVDHILHMPAAGDAGGDLLIRAGQEFGGDDHIFPAGKIPQSPSQEPLTGAALVGDGGIEEVDAQLQPPADDLPAVLLIQRPAVLAVGRVAKTHAAHTDAADSQPGIAQLAILHPRALLTPALRRRRHPPAPATRWPFRCRAPQRRCGQTSCPSWRRASV